MSGTVTYYGDKAQVAAVAATLAMPADDVRAMFTAAGRDGTVAAIRAFVSAQLGPTYEQIEAGAKAPATIDPTVVAVVVAAGAAAGWFILYDVLTADGTTVRIVAAREQVQAVADALGMPLDTASRMFGEAAQNGTVDAVRRYMAGRLGVTIEEVETGAIPGEVIDHTLAQVVLAAGQAGGWFDAWQVAT